MKAEYIIGIVIVVLVGVGLLVLGGSSEKMESGAMMTDQKQKGAPYIDIVNPSGFVNTDPITIKQFIGEKIIMLDFLTYSCINCQRTFPYLNAWDKEYEDDGLLIIGIHTPEFAFEKNIDNVREAMEKFGITHPIVLDNDYATWSAYGNRYWPRRYLIDIHGNIVYDHIGEGAYEETEKKIKELLSERAEVLGESMIQSDELSISDIEEESIVRRSPETYFGASRNEHLGNGKRGTLGEQKFAAPEKPVRNTLYFDGAWDITEEYATNTEKDAKIIYTFSAQKVHFVAGSDKPVNVTVMVDGKEFGKQVIQKNTLYTLVEDMTPGDHVLEIIVHDTGLEAYTFTFG